MPAPGGPDSKLGQVDGRMPGHIRGVMSERTQSKGALVSILTLQQQLSIFSWVSTEYPNEPVEQRGATKKDTTRRIPHRPRPLKLARRESPALIRTFELGDKFLRFLYSLFVEQGTDQDG